MRLQRLQPVFPALLTATFVLLAREPSIGGTPGACELLRQAGAAKILGGKLAGLGSTTQTIKGGASASTCVVGADGSGGTFVVVTFAKAADAKAALERAAHGDNMLAASDDPKTRAAAGRQVITNDLGVPTLFLPAEESGFMYAQKGKQLLQTWGMHANDGRHRELARKLLMAVVQKT